MADTEDLHVERLVLAAYDERVKELFGRFVKGDVDRYEVPNVRSLNFVLHEALDGGAARSLRSDPLGK